MSEEATAEQGRGECCRDCTRSAARLEARSLVRVGIPCRRARRLRPRCPATSRRSRAFLGRYARLDAPYEHVVDVGAREGAVPALPRAARTRSRRLRTTRGWSASSTCRSSSPSREPTLFDKPTNEACLSCHIDLRTVSPKGDLNIPHRAHVAGAQDEVRRLPRLPRPRGEPRGQAHAADGGLPELPRRRARRRTRARRATPTRSSR